MDEIPQKKALFLDRDGTINVDHGYVYLPQDFELIEGIVDLCRRAQDLGYLIIVITNQSGIARGYYTEADYDKITAHMVKMFAEQGVHITDVLHCPELSGPNRKPAPGLFLQARDKHGIAMSESVSLGDKPRDAEAAQSAGCGKNFIFDGDYTPVMQAL